MVGASFYRRPLRALRNFIHRSTGGERPIPRRNVLYEVDAEFQKIRQEALLRTVTPDGGAKSAEKLYNTLQFFKAATKAGGRIAECGVFRGLSAYVFCRYQQLSNPGYSGQGLSLFDSFEGLSAPTSEDELRADGGAFIDGKFREKGAFHGGLEIVRNTLRDFPDVKCHPGWIPQVFDGMPEAEYSFVHIDVDLYEPTKGAIEYFYPRLRDGGVIVCDDYAFLHWPGAKQAIDEYCVARGIPVIPLTTGQCVVLKSCGN
jgi:O-methyltransferase